MTTTRPVILTAAFWLDTLERTVTAVASVALGLFGANLTDPITINWSSFWWTILFTAVTRVLLCIVARSVRSSPVPNASFFLASGKEAEKPTA